MAVPLYALLIAADFYFPNLTPDETTFESLEGCVRDIERIEKELLLGRLKVPPEFILKLKASNTGGDAPPEPESDWPTYENIIAKFAELTESAESGSQVYIHYSGHGGRASTIFPEIKGTGGIDETLVPINIEDVSNRYVRDVEMAHLLKKMVDKGLIVMVVLDSCHSGGLTRGGGKDVAVRGTEKIDRRQRPTGSLVATHDELRRTFQVLTDNGMRGVKTGAGWVPEPQGYVLLAACRQNESAIEFRFDGKTRAGALTHWLLHSLQHLGPDVSWKQVHDRVHAKLTSQFAQQTPQLYGEVGRRVFGLDQVPPLYAVNVLGIDEQKGVHLNTGEALGTTEGAGFAIFPAATDFSQPDQRLAIVEVTELKASDSWARIVEKTGARNVEEGDQAVLIDTGVLSERNKVRLVEEEPPPDANLRALSLEAVRQAMTQHGKGFLQEGGQGEAVGYQIAISEGGEYEILDPQGNPFKIRPAIGINDQNAAERVVKRVLHLYTYQTIQQIKNTDAFSPLAGKLLVEVFKAPPGAKSGPPPANPQPLDASDGVPHVKAGDKIYLHIKNLSEHQDFNIAVLDLAADWSIEQFMPSSKSGNNTFTLESGKEVWEVLKAGIPSGQTEGRDILRAVATITDASFRRLELPPLDNPLPDSTTRGLPQGLVERMLALYTDDQPRMRKFEQEVAASSEWVSAEVVIEVR